MAKGDLSAAMVHALKKMQQLAAVLDACALRSASRWKLREPTLRALVKRGYAQQVYGRWTGRRYKLSAKGASWRG